MLNVATLASGSSGNCAVISDGRIHILMDAGIPAKRITTALKALGIEPKQIAGILITHEHSDHISGLPVLCKHLSADLYTTEPTARQICRRTAGLEERFQVFRPGERFAIGGLTVGTFAVSHDCACPVGYSVSDGLRKLTLCTDTGLLTQGALENVRRADTLIGEFNYDLDMLRAGPYPACLKKRILSGQGHLSNEMGGELASCAVTQGAHRVILAHLSKDNNSPEKAMAAAQRAMAGIGARVGTDVELLAAPRNQSSGWLEV